MRSIMRIEGDPQWEELRAALRELAQAVKEDPLALWLACVIERMLDALEARKR